MCQSAVCERQFVDIFALSNQAADKVAGPDIMDKVAKELTPIRVIPEVLNDAAAIRIAVCDLKFPWGGCRIFGQQERLKRVLPCHVNDRFMGKKAIAG
jgi:hypothetical protein